MKKSQSLDVPVAKATTYTSAWDAQLIWDIKDIDTMIQLRKSFTSPEMTIDGKEYGRGKTVWRIDLRSDTNLNLSLEMLTRDSNFFDCAFDFTLGGQIFVKSGVYIGKYERSSGFYASSAGSWNVTSDEKSFTLAEPTYKRLKERWRFSDCNFRVTVNLRITLRMMDSVDAIGSFPTLSASTCLAKNWVAELYNESLHSDVTIKCGAEVFHCHKLILRQSTVFEKMITSPMLEAQTNVITPSDISPSVMELFLKSLYGIQIIVPTEYKALLELINCAEKYDMQALKLTCLEAMPRLLSDDNAGELALAAFQYCQDEKFRWFFKKYCQERHATLVKNPAYQELFKSNLDIFI